jgi:ATP-binding cassette subfamily B protein
MSGRLEPQVERAVSARYYTAVTGVEVEATERPTARSLIGPFRNDRSDAAPA